MTLDTTPSIAATIAGLQKQIDDYEIIWKSAASLSLSWRELAKVKGTTRGEIYRICSVQLATALVMDLSPGAATS